MDRLISEQKAIEAINDYWGEMEMPTIDGYINAIKAIPSAEPKIGHWIFDEILDRNYYCSECKSMGVDYWDYCPYCGCKMVEPQESEEV